MLNIRNLKSNVKNVLEKLGAVNQKAPKVMLPEEEGFERVLCMDGMFTIRGSLFIFAASLQKSTKRDRAPSKREICDWL